MKYYTDCISVTLAEKLKEKGMPDIEIKWNPIQGKHYCFKTYAEVFNWLMETNIRITLHTYPAREPFAWGYRLWSMDGYLVYDPNPMPYMDELVCYPSWTEAADAAIEKAIELLKDLDYE